MPAFGIDVTTSCFFFLIFICYLNVVSNYIFWFDYLTFEIDGIPIERTEMIPIGFKGQRIVPRALVQQSI